MASQGCLEGPEGLKMVFVSNFKPNKGLDFFFFQMPLNLGFSGSSFRMLSIGIIIKFYICANLGHLQYYFSLNFELIKKPSWGFVCIIKRNIFPRGINSGIFIVGGKFLHKSSGG